MARKDEHVDGIEQTRLSETRQMIPAKKLKELLKTMATGRKQQVKLAGEVGSEVKTAIERYGCNRKVLRLIYMLDGMENEDIADFLDEFEYMLDASGIEKRAESAPGFEKMRPGTDENVHQLRAAE